MVWFPGFSETKLTVELKKVMMMNVGLDAMSLSPLGLDPIGQLDWTAKHGFAGYQFGCLGADVAQLREIRRHADELGLYSHTSVSSPNPHIGGGSQEERRRTIATQVNDAAECSWHELHTSLGGPNDRYKSDVPWHDQLRDAAEMIASLGDLLRDHGSRVNIETHGDTTTFELVRLAEEVGPDICGICLDTANVLLFGENPVEAARRAAPYVHLTHSKDAIVYFTDKGLQRQGRAPGAGVVQWPEILPILGEYSPNLSLSIEDHKWLFDAEIFETWWHREQADLSREELCQVVCLARCCQQKIDAGEFPEPEAYEQIEFKEEMDERLAAGRDYLQNLVKELGLSR